jgi:choline dehydrogenase-like flavoprotein
VLPYFKRSEHNARGASEYHGAGGELWVSEQRSPRALDRRILDASVAAGIPRIADYNGPEQDGVSMFQVLQKNGRRWSAADAFLAPVRSRANLEVRTNVLVERLALEGSRVTGVHYRGRRGGSTLVRAGAEVILAAGAIGSPQILQLSGVGNPQDLEAVGVKVTHDLPGVGANLQDHPFQTLNFAVTESGTLYGADKPKPMAEWVLRRTGPLTSTVAEVNAFVRSRPGLPAADLQFHMGAAYFDDHGAIEYPGDAIVIGPVLVAPRSRGKVWLRSSDPADKPRILTNSLSEPEDLDVLVAGVELARRIAAESPLAEVISHEITPGPDAVDRDAIEADIRRRMMLIYHPVGTCAMGDGEHAVLDAELKVRGLEGLRVADASVMPTITRGNTHAPCVMIGEKASDLVLGRTLAAAGVAG